VHCGQFGVGRHLTDVEADKSFFASMPRRPVRSALLTCAEAAWTPCDGSNF
jgi:hypothetical protein